MYKRQVGNIAGCYVTDGYIRRDCGIRLIRDGVVIYEGKLASLKRFKDDAKEVASGYECGMTIENYNDIKEGDIVEGYIDVYKRQIISQQRMLIQKKSLVKVMSIVPVQSQL